MPNKWTFKIKPIRQLIQKYIGDGSGWIDPFAGNYSLAKWTNDLNPKTNAKFHSDGLDFLRCQDELFSGCLYDPPYSFAQAKECYDSFGSELFNTHKNIPRKIWKLIFDDIIFDA